MQSSPLPNVDVLEIGKDQSMRRRRGVRCRPIGRTAAAFNACSRNPTVQGALPGEFFDFKTVPKAPPGILLVLAIVAYTATLSSFLYLMYVGYHDTTTVTKIASRDLTHDATEHPWTCVMISKVTEDVSLSTNTSFGLYAVLETETECVSDLDSFNCGKALRYGGSDTVSDLAAGASTLDPRGLAVSSTGTLYLADPTAGAVYKYDATLGTVDTLVDSLSFPVDVAVDDSSNVYILDQSSSIHKYDASTGSAIDLNVSWQYSNGETCYGIDVDSIGDLYLASSKGLEKYDISAGSASMLTSYSAGPPPSYTNTQGVAVDTNFDVYFSDLESLYKYDAATGVISTLMDSDSSSMSSGDAVAVTDRYVYVTDRSNVAIYSYDKSTGSVSTLLSSTDLTDPYGVAVDSSGAALFISDNGEHKVYRYDASSASVVGNLQEHKGSTGWFACAGEAQSTFPTSTAAALGACSLNGITWKTEMTVGYFFTEADAGDFAIKFVNSSSVDLPCSPGTRTAICDYVRFLPPYSCSYKKRSGWVTIIGNAFANTELLYLLVCSLLLQLFDLVKTLATRLNKRRSACASCEVSDGDGDVGNDDESARHDAHRSRTLNVHASAQIADRDLQIEALRSEIAVMRSALQAAGIHVPDKSSDSDLAPQQSAVDSRAAQQSQPAWSLEDLGFSWI
jgi:streptogramin lyase